MNHKCPYCFKTKFRKYKNKMICETCGAFHKVDKNFNAGIWIKTFIFLIFIFAILPSVSALTQVSACGTYSTANDVLNLTGNIVLFPTGAPCIYMTGDNQTFNGNGYSIMNTSTGNYLIRANNPNQTINNVTLRGSVTGGYPMLLLNSHQQKVYGVNFSFGYQGIDISASLNLFNITNCFFENINTNDVYAEGSNANIFYNNNIHINFSGGGDSGAVKFIQLSNSTISNIVMKEGKQLTQIAMIVSGYNVTLNNNTFINSSNLDYDMYFNGVNFSTISNNYFKDNSTIGAGISLAVLSKNNILFGNVFNNTIYNYFYTLSDQGTANNIFYNENYFCKNSANSHGLKMDGNNLTVYNYYAEQCAFGLLFHNGTTSSNAWNITLYNISVGVYFIDDSSFNTLTNVSILGGNKGISFYHYGTNQYNKAPKYNNVSNVVILNMTLVGNDYGIYFENQTYGNIISNVYINYTLGAGYDVGAVDRSTNNSLINVSYNSSDESVDATSNFKRYWWYQAYAHNGFIPTPSALILVYNITSGNVYSQLTASTGYSPLSALLEYVNIGGTKTLSTPHNVTATANGWTLLDSFNISLTGSYLDDVGFPSFFNIFDYNPSITTSNTSQMLYYNITTQEGLSSAKLSWDGIIILYTTIV
jgi:hypothetical protein